MINYDVIIAGYGPTGAVAANLLGAQGLKVLVLEPNLEIYDIPRAVHFDGEVMRIFQALGLSEAIDDIAVATSSLTFINGRGWKLSHQDLLSVDRPNGWASDIFFNQPQLEQHLRDGVARYANVDVKPGWSLASLMQHTDKTDVCIRDHANDTEQWVSCDWLLACDGASSPTRKMLSITLEDLQCDEPWLVTDLMLEPGTEYYKGAFQVCDPKRPATIVPCEGTHIRWEFMLNSDDNIEQLESEENAREMMSHYLHHLSPTLTRDSGELIRSKVYNFHALVSETFQTDRIFLLGDAAHLTPPFLGQGLCAGVRDAYNLCWKLGGVIRGDYHADLLKSYTSERRPHVHEIITTAVKHGDIIQTRNPIKALLRDCFLMLGRAFPPLVSFLKFGFQWNLGAGLFATESAPVSGSVIGQPLPQPWIQTSDGQQQRLDELLGNGFSLLGFGFDPAQQLKDQPTKLLFNCLHVGADGGINDIDNSLTRWASNNDIAIALIRPDRQVYGICNTGATADISTQLSHLLARLQHQLNGTSP